MSSGEQRTTTISTIGQSITVSVAGLSLERRHRRSATTPQLRLGLTHSPTLSTMTTLAPSGSMSPGSGNRTDTWSASSWMRKHPEPKKRSPTMPSRSTRRSPRRFHLMGKPRTKPSPRWRWTRRTRRSTPSGRGPTPTCTTQRTSMMVAGARQLNWLMVSQQIVSMLASSIMGPRTISGSCMMTAEQSSIPNMKSQML